MTQKHEQLYLEAEADIRNNNFHEAFDKYESLLYEEPDFAPAHNSLGWIYKTQFDNYTKARIHFEEAIRSDPTYPHPYFHMAGLLIDLELYDELDIHLKKCLQIVSVDKSWVHYRFGMMEEMNGEFDAAIKNYNRAILHCMNNEKIGDYKLDIERCNTKIEITKVTKSWLSFK